MPSNAPEVKKIAVAGYGGNITYCEPTLQAREETLKKLTDELGLTIVHPYNNFKVICGQELLRWNCWRGKTTRYSDVSGRRRRLLSVRLSQPKPFFLPAKLLLPNPKMQTMLFVLSGMDSFILQ